MLFVSGCQSGEDVPRIVGADDGIGHAVTVIYQHLKGHIQLLVRYSVPIPK